MFERLHTLFISSKRNRFHPHALRPLGLLTVALVLAFIPTLYNAVSAGTFQILGYATNISVGEVHNLSNQQRTSNGVAALNLNSSLNQAAANKAAHMFANNYWAHNAPDGTTPWSFINGAGYVYSVAGENLAKNFMTSSGVVNGWMNSAGHRANVLNGSFVDVGYAVVNGTLQGQQTTLVVALYAAPATVAQAPRPTPQPAPNPTPAPAPSPQPAPTPTTPAPEPSPTPPVAPTAPEPEEDDEPTPPVAVTQPDEQPPQATDLSTQPIALPEPERGIAAVAGAMSAPLEAYQGLNWGQKTSLFLLSVIGLLYILKHTSIWRQRRGGLRSIWLRSHPLAQASFIIVMGVITIASGAGTVL